MIVYPSHLPRPVRDGYAISHVNPLRRVEMQTGRARQRRMYGSTPSMVSVAWRVTEKEAYLFEGFYRHTLLDGSEWFSCPLETPLGIQNYEARFAAMYQGPALIGRDVWEIQARLEMRQRNTLPAGAVAAPSALAVYPATLPVPLRDGYALDHADTMLRTTIDGGLAAQRRSYQMAPTRMRVELLLDVSEAQVFEAFYRHTLVDGARWFACPLRTPVGMDRIAARFVGMYQGPETIAPGQFRFDAVVEIRDRQTISSTWMDAPAFILQPEIFDLAMNQEWPQ